MAKSKGLPPAAMYVGLFALLVIAAGVGYSAFANSQAGAPTLLSAAVPSDSGGSQTTPNPADVASTACIFAGGGSSVRVAAQNLGALPSSDYAGAISLIAVDDSGAQIITGTSTGGATATATALTLSCGQRGKVLALGSNVYTGGEVAFSADKTTEPLRTVYGYNTSEPVFFLQDSSSANDTADSPNPDYDPTSVIHTLGAGASLTGKILVSMNASSSQFGAAKGGVFVTVVLPSAILENGWSLSSSSADWPLTPTSCAEFSGIAAITPGAGGSRICYKAPPLNTRTIVSSQYPANPAYPSSVGGVKTLEYSINTNGNPGANDNVQIFFDDVVPAQDGSVYGYIPVTSGGTQAGLTAQANVTIDLG